MNCEVGSGWEKVDIIASHGRAEGADFIAEMSKFKPAKRRPVGPEVPVGQGSMDPTAQFVSREGSARGRVNR